MDSGRIYSKLNADDYPCARVILRGSTSWQAGIQAGTHGVGRVLSSAVVALAVGADNDRPLCSHHLVDAARVRELGLPPLDVVRGDLTVGPRQLDDVPRLRQRPRRGGLA